MRIIEPYRLSLRSRPPTVTPSYGTESRSEKPLVHKITNKSDRPMFCIDAEVLKTPPVTSPIPLYAEHHTMIKERARCRVYKLSLMPGETATVSYPFFYLSIVLRGSRVQTTIGASSAGAERSVSWVKAAAMGDEEWCAPALDIGIKNLGEGVYEQFIAEWR